MNQTKKALLVLFCVSLIGATMTSCSRKSKSGCPTWSKAKQEQSFKKNA